MYSILLVSADEEFRKLAARFVPKVDRNLDLHMANGADAAITALNGDGGIELVAFDHTRDRDVIDFLDLADRSRFDLPVIVISRTAEPALMGELINRHIQGYIARGGRDPTEFFMEFCDRVVMTAERSRIDGERRANERRMESMIEMAKMDQSDFQKVIEYALERSIELTASQIGYVSAYDPKTRKLRMLAWSRGAMRSCAMSDYPVEFDLDTTGIWGEPIRLRKTVVVNDYDMDSRAMKKGTPTGHVKLKRLLMVPIHLDGEVIGTAGVGNKATEYTWNDEKQLKIMMEDLFAIHREMEMSEMQNFHKDVIGRFIETGPMGLVFTDSDLNVIMMNQVARAVLGAEDMPEHFHLPDVRTTQVKDVLEQVDGVVKSGSPQRSRVLMTLDKLNMAFECFVQMSEIADDRSGFMILLNDITDLSSLDGDVRRVQDHVAVLEGPVLNSMIASSAELEPSLSSVGAWTRLQSAIRFMDDYRTSGKERPAWMRLETVIDRASRASALGGVELTVKAAGIEILADPAFPLVFKHLFNNSLAHGGMVTAIDVRCRITRGNMTIVYSDNGSGVSDEIRDRVFDMTGEGHFGLFLVSSIVESSGYTIRCLPSESGALFEIDVPPESYSLV